MSGSNVQNFTFPDLGFSFTVNIFLVVLHLESGKILGYKKVLVANKGHHVTCENHPSRRGADDSVDKTGFHTSFFPS